MKAFKLETSVQPVLVDQNNYLPSSEVSSLKIKELIKRREII